MQSVLHPIIGPAGPEKADLSGQVAIVTGGALGIGYEVSRAFALMGCKVIMVNRKEEQGDEAIAKIKAEAAEKGVNDVQIEWKGCDLGTLKQVKEVFSELAEKEDRLDFLILSAGINTNQFGLDNDGIDRHFGGELRLSRKEYDQTLMNDPLSQSMRWATSAYHPDIMKTFAKLTFVSVDSSSPSTSSTLYSARPPRSRTLLLLVSCLRAVRCIVSHLPTCTLRRLKRSTIRRLIRRSCTEGPNWR